MQKMEASVRYPLLAATAAAAAIASTSSAVVDAFTMPQTQIKTKHTSSLCAIGLGPEVEEKEDDNGAPVAEIDVNKWDYANPYTTNNYDPNRIIRNEDGEVLPHITDFEPYRTERMTNSDRDADAWFGALLESEGGESFLGSVSAQHKERLLSKVELVDEPVLKYGEDEEWTPYVSRRLPTSPLYPSYGLETYGLPVLRRGAEAWYARPF